MSTKVYWLEEPWLMSADYEGHITSQNIETLMHECLAFLEDHTIYFIVDSAKTMSWPLINVNMLPATLRLISHPNVRCFAFVGLARFGKLAASSACRRPYRHFDNREDAIVYLRKLAETEGMLTPSTTV